MCFSSSATAGATWSSCAAKHESDRCLGRAATSRNLSLRVSYTPPDLRSRRHLLDRSDHQRRSGRCSWNQGASAIRALGRMGSPRDCRDRPPGTSRPRHRPRRAPPAAASIESFVTYYNVDRTHIGVGKGSPSGRLAEQRGPGRKPKSSASPGRRPASPLRMAPGGVSRFGPEVHLDRAAGSVSGRGSCARGPMAPSIRPSWTTTEAPSPASVRPVPSRLVRRALHGSCFGDPHANSGVRAKASVPLDRGVGIDKNSTISSPPADP